VENDIVSPQVNNFHNFVKILRLRNIVWRDWSGNILRMGQIDLPPILQCRGIGRRGTWGILSGSGGNFVGRDYNVRVQIFWQLVFWIVGLLVFSSVRMEEKGESTGGIVGEVLQVERLMVVYRCFWRMEGG
jgi:hypothetical protein